MALEISEKNLMFKKIGSFMSKPVATIDSDATITEASRIMSEKSIGCLVVTQKGVPLGVITERDLVRKVLAQGIDPKHTKVSQCVTSPLVTISSKETVKDAALKMYINEVRRLPVVDDDKVVGIVTASDLARLLIGVMSHEAMLLQSIARYHKYGY